MLKKDVDKWLFRVHASLAPRYGFSYRGAMYATKVLPTELDSFLTARGDEDREKHVLACLKRIHGTKDERLPLFEDEADD